jgi:hypothetical protein
MSQKKQKHPFKKCETGYHKYAVRQLAEWVGGEIEKPFYIDGAIVFVPDVTKDEKLYEVVYSHEMNGRKLNNIMDYCHRNATELTVFEVSANFILEQTEKPENIRIMDCYIMQI